MGQSGIDFMQNNVQTFAKEPLFAPFF